MSENWYKDYSNLELHSEEALGQNNSLVKMLSFIGSSKRVIDFGCASGYFSKLLTKIIQTASREIRHCKLICTLFSINHKNLGICFDRLIINC